MRNRSVISSTSQNRRSGNFYIPVVRLCNFCGLREARKHTFHCSDECRFWSKVRKGPNCWEWTAGLKFFGYGQFWGGEGPVGAHVFSWTLSHGPIEKGLWVLHHCDNP